ncbi:Conserved_hypothetical protein [Hexamita inflata]|uniref:Uncharacterized protein n=1 Tax=Hexamita inflata TaxID=28002 RepID=A0AA86V1K9_9EUKA|nr:Conserved hypothetical protein [Hexamita inflata]
MSQHKVLRSTLDQTIIENDNLTQQIKNKDLIITQTKDQVFQKQKEVEERNQEIKSLQKQIQQLQQIQQSKNIPLTPEYNKISSEKHSVEIYNQQQPKLVQSHMNEESILSRDETPAPMDLDVVQAQKQQIDNLRVELQKMQQQQQQKDTTIRDLMSVLSVFEAKETDYLQQVKELKEELKAVHQSEQSQSEQLMFLQEKQAEYQQLNILYKEQVQLNQNLQKEVQTIPQLKTLLRKRENQMKVLEQSYEEVNIKYEELRINKEREQDQVNLLIQSMTDQKTKKESLESSSTPGPENNNEFTQLQNKAQLLEIQLERLTKKEKTVKTTVLQIVNQFQSELYQGCFDIETVNAKMSLITKNLAEIEKKIHLTEPKLSMSQLDNNEEKIKLLEEKLVQEINKYKQKLAEAEEKLQQQLKAHELEMRSQSQSKILESAAESVMSENNLALKLEHDALKQELYQVQSVGTIEREQYLKQINLLNQKVKQLEDAQLNDETAQQQIKQATETINLWKSRYDEILKQKQEIVSITQEESQDLKEKLAQYEQVITDQNNHIEEIKKQNDQTIFQQKLTLDKLQFENQQLQKQVLEAKNSSFHLSNTSRTNLSKTQQINEDIVLMDKQIEFYKNQYNQLQKESTEKYEMLHKQFEELQQQNDDQHEQQSQLKYKLELEKVQFENQQQAVVINDLQRQLKRESKQNLEKPETEKSLIEYQKLLQTVPMLNQQVEFFKLKTEELQTQLHENMQTVHDKELELTKVSQIMQQFEESNQLLQHRVEALQSNHETQLAHQKDIHQLEINKLYLSNQQLQTQIDDLKKNQSKELQNTEMQALNRKLTMQNAKYEKEIELLTAKTQNIPMLQQKEIELEHVKSQLELTESQKEEMQRIIDELQFNLEQNEQNSNNIVKIEVQSLTDKIEVLNKQLELNKQQYVETSNQLKVCRQQSSDKEKSYKQEQLQSQDEIRKAKFQIQALQKDVEDAKFASANQLNLVSLELTKLKEENNRLEQQVQQKRALEDSILMEQTLQISSEFEQMSQLTLQFKQKISEQEKVLENERKKFELKQQQDKQIISQLQAQVSEQQTKIQQLQDTIEQNQQEKIQEVNNSYAEQSEMQVKLDQLQLQEQQSQFFKSQAESLTLQVSDLKRQLIESQKLLLQLQQENKQSKSALQKSKEELEKAKKLIEITQFQQKLDHDKNYFEQEQLKNKMSEIQKEREMRDLHSTQEFEIQIQQQFDEMKTIKSELETKIFALQQENEQLKTKAKENVKEIQIQGNEQHKLLLEQKQIIERLSAKLKQCQEQRDEMSQKLSENTQKMQMTQTNTEQIQKQTIQTQKQQISDLLNQVDTLIQQNTKLKEKTQDTTMFRIQSNDDAKTINELKKQITECHQLLNGNQSVQIIGELREMKQLLPYQGATEIKQKLDIIIKKLDNFNPTPMNDVLDNLLQKINSLEKTGFINTSQVQIEDFEPHNSLYSTQFKSQNQKQYQAQDVNFQSEINSLNKQIQDLTDQLTREKLKQCQQTNELYLEKQIQLYESDLKQTVQKLEAVQAEKWKIEQHNQQLVLQMNQLKSELEDQKQLQQKFVQKEKIIDAQQQQLIDLRTTFSELNSLIKIHCGSDKNLLDQVQNLLKLRQKQSDMENDLVMLQSKYEESEQQRKEIRRRAREERDLRLELEAKVKAFENKYSEQENKLLKYRKDLTEIRQFAMEYTDMVAKEFDRINKRQAIKDMK